MIVFVEDNVVAEHLLVRIQPCCNYDVQNWGTGEYLQDLIVQRRGLDLRSLVHVSHAKALGNVENDQTEQGDWKNDGHPWSEHERYIGDSKYLCVLYVNVKDASRVEFRELLDRVTSTLLLIARRAKANASFLVATTLNMPQEPKSYDLDQRHEAAE